MHHPKSAIEKWLSERQNLIVTLHHLCTYRPFTKAKHSCVMPILKEFCELLIDYIARGHFDIFEKMHTVIKHSPPQWIEDLLKITKVCLSFNDKYENAIGFEQLEGDLSYLVQRLAYRLDIEDKMIAIYAHQKKISLGHTSNKVA